MVSVTFITGNQGKADFLAKFLGLEIPHVKLDLDEIQSLDLREISEHKVRQAYEKIRKPVLVEDVGFTLEALGKLPGPFIKWFLESLGDEGVCRLLDGYESRRAFGQVCYAYYDGKKVKFFEGRVNGTVPSKPRGSRFFGWDFIFIPDGTNKTYSEMDDQELEKFSLRTTTVYPEIKKFLSSIDKT